MNQVQPTKKGEDKAPSSALSEDTIVIRILCFALLLLMVANRPVGAQAAPSSASALVERGFALLKGGQVTRAAEAFREAIAKDPHQAEAHKMLGIIEGRQGQTADAIRHLEIAHELRPSSPEIAYDLALAYFEAGVPQSTIDVLQTAPKRMYSSAVVNRLWGDALVRTGRYTQGVRQLQKSLEEDTQPGTSYDLGLALLKAGNQFEAETFLLQAASRFPKSSDLRVALGIAQYMSGKSKEAEGSFLMATRLGGSAGAAYVTLGDFYLTTGHTTEAIAAYKTALAKDPTNADAYEKEGEALARNNRLKEAIQAYRRSLQLNPREVNAHVGMGKALLKLGQLTEARDAFEQAIHANPQDREAYYQLAQVLWKLGDRSRAQQMLARWNQMNPSRIHSSGNQR